MSCEDRFNGTVYMALSGIGVFLGLLSFICSILVVLVIILFKRYHYFVQRLVLYVCIAASINSLTIILQRIEHFEIGGHQNNYFCTLTGFLELYTSLVQLLSLLCITHGLYLSVVKQNPKKRWECFYIAFSLLAPILVCCIPFFNSIHAYGIGYSRSGPWCWIREKKINKSDSCQQDPVGVVIQFGIWYIPLVLVTIIVLAVSMATLYRVHKSMDNHWQGPYDPDVFVNRGRLRKAIMMILSYLPILYLLTSLLSLPNAIHWALSEDPEPVLWYLDGFVVPLRGMFLAVPYLMHTHTRKQISMNTIIAAFKRRFTRKRVTAYPAVPVVFSDSLTFPSAGDATLERQQPYHNPSLSYNTPTSPLTLSPAQLAEEGVVTLNLEEDSSTLSSLNVSNQNNSKNMVSSANSSHNQTHSDE